MHSGLGRIAIICFLLANGIFWSQHSLPSSSFQNYNINLRRQDSEYAKRSVDFFNDPAVEEQKQTECFPLLLPLEDQCRHVQKECDGSRTFLSIQYLQAYFCSASPLRIPTFIGLLIWLIFLFSTLGISASDFFCPNLATLAELLGLDENVAGVTFLAFGNGSPDVFSTFSAMRADSGSLAIGELLGAASFIVSCVVGSMCIIKEFQVERFPFLRDVGFFTVAVLLLLVILWDGTIHLWESCTLIALYVAYVIVVVVGSWWDNRRRMMIKTEAIVRGEYGDDDMTTGSTERYRDDPSTPDSQYPRLAAPFPQRPRAISAPGPLLGIDTQNLSRRISRSPSPSATTHHSQMPSFSLVGALEFRQVIASLQNQSSENALRVFEHTPPVTPFGYGGGHYNHYRHSYSHTHRHGGTSRPRTPHYSSETDPWDAALGENVPLSDRSRRVSMSASTPALPHRSTSNIAAFRSLHSEDISGTMSEPIINLDSHQTQPIEASPHLTSIPSISVSQIPSSPSDTSVDTEPQLYVPPTRRQRFMRILAHTFHILFPTLNNLGDKSILGMTVSILAAPAVLVLTLTLPVLITPRPGSSPEEKFLHIPSEARLVDFEEEGVDRVMLTAEEEVQEEMHDIHFNKWLMATQCALGPLFCVAVLAAGMKQEVWLLIATAVAGFTLSVVVAVFADYGNNPAARLARCFMGFFIAVVWIMAIADEVVNVLKTFGFIFGLSDAIIGLTIFAVGNSLADFVANMSVAAFAPIMGFSACFGGPMLNILLGVGISGFYVINKTGENFTFKFSTTLMVSTIGLLVLLGGTILFVPWNGYKLTKRWGIFLIFSYIIIMTINVIVEIKRKTSG